MNTCGLTRLLVPAFLIGFAVATISGIDLYGWVAAGTTVAILAAVQKVRGAGPTCAIAPPPAVSERVDAESGTASSDLPSR